MTVYDILASFDVELRSKFEFSEEDAVETDFVFKS